MDTMSSTAASQGAAMEYEITIRETSSGDFMAFVGDSPVVATAWTCEATAATEAQRIMEHRHRLNAENAAKISPELRAEIDERMAAMEARKAATARKRAEFLARREIAKGI